MAFSSERGRIVPRSSVPELETARLLLRQATAGDLADWADRIFADPDVIRYLPRRELTPRARAERALGIYIQTWAAHPYGGWLISNRVDGELVGHCGFEYLQDTHEAELGYALARRFWGKGLAKEAARAATRFGFEVAGLERIIAVVAPANEASWRVLGDIGFMCERTTRYHDLEVLYYSITRAQFKPDNSFFYVRMSGDAS